jgi:hypothetical protein
MNGAANKMGKIARPRSMVKRSEEIREINFPELVSVIDFIESLTTLSKSAATRVLLNFNEIYTPSNIYLFLKT